jgi:transposase
MKPFVEGEDVKPYVKRRKTDAGDAEAICEAVGRPTMRFVAVKPVEQQAALSQHRTRDLLVRQRTQLVNMIRGLLAEFGIDIPSCSGWTSIVVDSRWQQSPFISVIYG